MMSLRPASYGATFRRAMIHAAALTALAHEPGELRPVQVSGRADSLLEFAESAAEGYVGQDHLEFRPVQRPGEVLESVPGLIATQHSGNGKANQYFLRGFNLDHGTDFATTVEGIGVNLPSHGHGQGYTDLNFLLPELVQTVHYRKGPYYADVGDFASAGAADIGYVNRLERNLAQLEVGSFGYARGLFAASPKAGPGTLLYAFEVLHDDGPWKRPSDYQKFNGVLKYSQGNEARGFSISALGYHGRWHSTDQIPRNAVADLSGGRFGTLDPSDGGDSQRYSLRAEWHRSDEHSHTSLQAYGAFYDFDLFSNFTYFLDDPVRGDQFQQYDRRWFAGASGHHTWYHEVAGRDWETSVGLQLRCDDTHNGLNHTEARQLVDVTRSDRVRQFNVSPYAENTARWSPWLRSHLGARLDYSNFDVRNFAGANSGQRDASLLSPKGSLVLGPWAKTELYLSGGLGFHSNDGRGVTSAADPASPLVRTYGAEVGLRTLALTNLQSSLSLWYLDVDSELLFVGDAGNTEASGATRRFGVEWANYWTPTPWLTLDADFSLSRTRFRNAFDAAGEFVGDRVPGSVEAVVAAGVSVRDPDPNHGFFASLRLRFFGPRPLVEDNSQRSGATLLLNAQAGYRFNRTWSLQADAFNLLDRADSDIDYYYESRPSRTGPVAADVHFHPVEPLSARVSVTARF